MIDLMFFLAIGAIGWGLSLALYRPVAERAGWPLGEAQERLPTLTLLIALSSIAAGVAFALVRGPMDGGVVILIFGVGLAIFWSGFLRVASQTSLFFAPLAALLLAGAWAGAIPGVS
ncbi:DUF3325 domain-containing protein [Hyphomicrobium sp. 1Nfss2.1]|uniref:hypothetical protein n=1 Tax=Hyphomicrobium sp. 1Nfss2.1 TaxID=3413936 RepID=UPI003C7C0AFB